ncbi:MAG: transposase [Verrucomicrobia bacterium]|nr:transposase [Verrucomicrobiota bacterium]
MAKSVLECNGISQEMVGLVSGLIDNVPWPDRRKAMGEVAVTMLNGSPRLAESIFGWKRTTVELGIHEFQGGFRCEDNISGRRRKKTEEKHPQLLLDIQRMVDPHSHADHQLRTDLAHRNVTAQAVRDALVEMGWKDEEVPTTRTISNLLNRHGYRVRSVAKTKVQKKRLKPMPSSSGFGR